MMREYDCQMIAKIHINGDKLRLKTSIEPSSVPNVIHQNIC